MFLNRSMLKRMMKEAYKEKNGESGLKISMNESTLYIGGDWWGVQISLHDVPKDIWAKIIELAGVIPESMECFQATEGGNQMELECIKIKVPSAASLLMATDFVMTNDEPRRICQHAGTGKVKLIKESYFQLATTGERSELEAEVKGPLWMDDGSMYYFSYTTILKVHEMSTRKHAKIMEGMQCMELYKDEREK